MNRSRKFFLAALGFLVLALLSFLFSKRTIQGLIRQRVDEQAAEAYIQAALSKEDEEKKTKEEDSVSETEGRTEPKIKMKKEETNVGLVPEAVEKTVNEIETFSRTPSLEQPEICAEKNMETPVRESRESPDEDLPEPTPSEPTLLERSVEFSHMGMAEPSYVPVTDDAYYERGGVVYTPEYAVGRIDCVLEIPCISLKRCVYSGTDEEIAADLDMWFTVSASGALIPGETHYAIFGHNHTVQNLSFNRLAEVSVGDYFTLTRDSEVYIYLVTDMFAAERSAGRAAYAYNDALDPSLCYIFTCGRDYMLLNGVSTRYKDLIVEGTLWRTVPAAAWMGEEEEEDVPEETTEAPKEDPPALRDALTEEQEKVRASHPSPVLTLNAEAGSFEASNTANNAAAPSFSWSLLLVYLTAGFSVASVLLFLLSFVMRLITVRDSKRASRRASA